MCVIALALSMFTCGLVLALAITIYVVHLRCKDKHHKPYFTRGV